jgi:hypothetical protein
VFARDGGQCTFLDRQGHRCPSRAFLELDHVESRALGGDDDVDNLRVRCRAHNQLHAEEVFGREHVARMIHFRQRKSDVPGDGLSQSAFGMGPSSGGVSWPRPAPPAEPME